MNNQTPLEDKIIKIVDDGFEKYYGIVKEQDLKQALRRCLDELEDLKKMVTLEFEEARKHDNSLGQLGSILMFGVSNQIDKKIAKIKEIFGEGLVG